MVTKHTHTIDASGRTLGRVASEAAKALMGKTHADYTPHIRSDVKVQVTNASKINMPERKRMAKEYRNYSGYPSGLRRERLAALSARKGMGEAVRRAVARMMPRNTMHTERLKNLTVTE
ncbi:MAG: 50S ribosomal protein L13 [Patescibacteria group bacterium]|nr:50S ribosomal protein L13 [bacterium]MDZ4226908.1 50S ribosomal protein L13 [Patescibacteria group bacterium]